MKLRITEAVLAEAYRAKVCRERMEELAESIRKSVKERHSLPKMRIRLAEYGNDTELMLAAGAHCGRIRKHRRQGTGISGHGCSCCAAHASMK